VVCAGVVVVVDVVVAVVVVVVVVVEVVLLVVDAVVVVVVAPVVVAGLVVVVVAGVVCAETVVVAVVVVAGAVVVVARVVVAAVVVVVDVVGGFATWPLSASAVSISFCTVATVAATAAGVPPAPSCGSASSSFSAAWIRETSWSVGWDLSVITSWSAIAVVTQAGQFTFSAPAASIGAISALRPTIRTTWNETATVVQRLQLASAKALFVFVTGAPSFTVTSA
jgi:hypothetical protein